MSKWHVHVLDGGKVTLELAGTRVGELDSLETALRLLDDLQPHDTFRERAALGLLLRPYRCAVGEAAAAVRLADELLAALYPEHGSRTE